MINQSYKTKIKRTRKTSCPVIRHFEDQLINIKESEGAELRKLLQIKL